MDFSIETFLFIFCWVFIIVLNIPLVAHEFKFLKLTMFNGAAMPTDGSERIDKEAPDVSHLRKHELGRIILYSSLSFIAFTIFNYQGWLGLSL